MSDFKRNGGCFRMYIARTLTPSHGSLVMFQRFGLQTDYGGWRVEEDISDGYCRGNELCDFGGIDQCFIAEQRRHDGFSRAFCGLGKFIESRYVHDDLRGQ